MAKPKILTSGLLLCFTVFVTLFALPECSNNGNGGDDSLNNSKEGANTALPDDDDYIVPIDQCCIHAHFGKFSRWCPVTNCFDSKGECINNCNDNHQLVAPHEFSSSGNGGDDSPAISREGVDVEDYIVPKGQRCMKVDFGRDTHRWCVITTCYNFKFSCFKYCHDSPLPADPHPPLPKPPRPVPPVSTLL